MSPRTPKPPQRKLARWRITRIKAKAVEIGTVEAPDAESYREVKQMAHDDRVVYRTACSIAVWARPRSVMPSAMASVV